MQNIRKSSQQTSFLHLKQSSPHRWYTCRFWGPTVLDLREAGSMGRSGGRLWVWVVHTLVTVAMCISLPTPPSWRTTRKTLVRIGVALCWISAWKLELGAAAEVVSIQGALATQPLSWAVRNAARLPSFSTVCIAPVTCGFPVWVTTEVLNQTSSWIVPWCSSVFVRGLAGPCLAF